MTDDTLSEPGSNVIVLSERRPDLVPVDGPAPVEPEPLDCAESGTFDAIAELWNPEPYSGDPMIQELSEAP